VPLALRPLSTLLPFRAGDSGDGDSSSTFVPLYVLNESDEEVPLYVLNASDEEVSLWVKP
jgi:hypothetical protein